MMEYRSNGSDSVPTLQYSISPILQGDPALSFTEVLDFPQVGENDRGMLFFSTDVVDNHHMLALREATPGAAMPEPEQIGMDHVSFELGTFAEL